MFSSKVTIQHMAGIHTRPAAIVVREAGRYKSEITLTAEEVTINAKSIMGLLTLALIPGSSVTITASGEDEKKAVETLAAPLSGEF